MHSLSITNLIQDASIFVKFIMLILFLAILISIFIFIKKYIYTKFVSRKNRQFKNAFWSDTNINDLYHSLIARDNFGLEHVFVAGFSEFRQFSESEFKFHDEVVITNCRRSMSVAAANEIGTQEKTLPILATIGSTSPYIGLLGTVYGIMYSFIALGSKSSVSISDIAPGIAEALIATAIGLLAAIPAVLIYNYFITKQDQLSTEYDAFIEEFTNVLQRQILRIKNS